MKVTPRGGKNCVLPYAAGDEWLKVKVTAPPEDGKANAAVVEVLADYFGVAKRDVKIVSGETSRMKQVLLNGKTAEEIGRYLSSDSSSSCS